MRVPRLHWRLLLAPPRTGAENMARDVYLMRRAGETGEAVFALYSWEKPTLSLGRNQPAAGIYDPGMMRDLGVDVVRRPTGGRALLHHREITYSVTMPLERAGTLAQAYARINAILIRGLQRLGVGVSEAQPAARAPMPSARPCFAEPVEGELVFGGRKLVGSAQLRDEHAVLQHGSILVFNDQYLLDRIRAAPHTGAVESALAPAVLSELLDAAPTAASSAETFFAAVRDVEDAGASALHEADLRSAVAPGVPHFENPQWTWRM